MKRFGLFLVCMFVLVFAGVAGATTYTEDFEADFPAWESGWLGTHTNLQNYYVVSGGGSHSDRGNNPDGLWLDDGNGVYSGSVDIIFDQQFGATLSSLFIDIAGYIPTQYQVYDMSNNLLLNQNVFLTYGAWTDPGVYSHYEAFSQNGISRFSFLQNDYNQIEGNTSIDNVVATTGGSTPQVPEPATMLLLSSIVTGLAGTRLLRKKQ